MDIADGYDAGRHENSAEIDSLTEIRQGNKVPMDLNLQPSSEICLVTGQPFQDGQRVASFLLEEKSGKELLRADVLESAMGQYQPPGSIVCRWVRPFKARKPGESGERTLKLTAESLFLTLADPATEPSEENTRLLQFLALLLERKRVIKPRGLSADGRRQRVEHSRSKQVLEFPVAELNPEFFLRVQEQLSVLVGVPKTKPLTQASPKAPVSPAPASVQPHDLHHVYPH